MDRPRTTVVVPAYGPPAQLDALLAALQDQHLAADEVLVVDNHATPTLRAPAPVRVLHEPRPGSFAARNRALAEATGDVAAFTDLDCLPRPGWLAAGVAALGPGQLVAGRIVTVTSSRPSLAESYDRATAFPQERYVADGHAATANLFAWRADLVALGGFDDELLSGADFDLTARAVAAGLELRYCAEAVVDHPARGTFGALAAKARRLTAGKLTAARRDGPSRTAATVLRLLRPPLRDALGAARAPGLGPVRRLGLLGVWASLRLVVAGECARWLVGRGEARR